MFVLVKSMYLCQTWESCWECTVVAFVAEAGLVSFAKIEFQKCKKMALTTPPPPFCIWRTEIHCSLMSSSYSIVSRDTMYITKRTAM